MITVLACTTRPDSMTSKVATYYADLLMAADAEVQVFCLSELPRDYVFSEMSTEKSGPMKEIIEVYIENVQKMVFVIPEYNGSYPGALKAFIDCVSPSSFRGKKAGIIGISDGHAGNLRGQEHLTGVLHFLKMLVHYSQPKLSSIGTMVDEKGQVTDERSKMLLQEHAEHMINF